MIKLSAFESPCYYNVLYFLNVNAHVRNRNIACVVNDEAFFHNCIGVLEKLCKISLTSKVPPKVCKFAQLLTETCKLVDVSENLLT